MLNKTENLWKIVGCFWTWQNGVFGGFFFWGFNVIVVSFWCVWHSSKSVKNACFFFPSLGAFVGWVIFVYLGLEGLGVLVFLCLFFFFCVGFVSVLFALFLFSCWIVFGVGSCFVFVFFFLLLFFVCFCFWRRVFWRVRWPKGPPHLALNPPFFVLFFCFFFCFLFLFFVFCFFFWGRV